MPFNTCGFSTLLEMNTQRQASQQQDQSFKSVADDATVQRLQQLASEQRSDINSLNETLAIDPVIFHFTQQ